MANSIKVYDNASDLIVELQRALKISPSPFEFTGDGYMIAVNAPIKRNNLFFINAFCNMKAALGRSQEEEERLVKCETFKIDMESFAANLLRHSENVEVDNYSDMKMEFEKYLKNTLKNHTPTDIALVFLGHGNIEDITGNAMLCFEDQKWPLVNEVIDEMHDIHKNAGIKSSLMIVFSQCYSHKHNSKTLGDAKQGTFCKASGSCGTKFMFLSSDEKPETRSDVRLISQPKSSGLQIIGKDLFVDNCMMLPDDALTLLFLNSKKLKDYIKNEFKVKLDGKETMNLFRKESVPQTPDGVIISRNLDKIKGKIAQLKKEIKYYNHFKIRNPYSEKAASSVYEHLPCNANVYPFGTVEVDSFDNLKNSMVKFMDVSCEIPIIFISGYCKKENDSRASEKYQMVFNNNENKSIEDILDIVKTSDVRVTFFCEDFVEDVGDCAPLASGDISIYSESVEKIESAEHLELGKAMKNIARKASSYNEKKKARCQLL